jgi:predicted nucleotidyltransferase
MSTRDLDLSPYIAGLRQRATARARRERERRDRLQAALPGAVRRLVRDFGVTRVVLFGSLARDTAGLQSDVDLLVDGLPPERPFEAVAAVSRDLGADVDLIPSEAARPSVLRRALSEGRALHGSSIVRGAPSHHR